jgi:hypothetical protein
MISLFFTCSRYNPKTDAMLLFPARAPPYSCSCILTTAGSPFFNKIGSESFSVIDLTSPDSKKMKKGPHLLTQQKLSFAPKRSPKSSTTTTTVAHEHHVRTTVMVTVSTQNSSVPLASAGLFSGELGGAATVPFTVPASFKKVVNTYIKKPKCASQLPVATVPALAAARVSLPFASHSIYEPVMVAADATLLEYQPQLAVSAKEFPSNGKEVLHKKKSTTKHSSPRAVTSQSNRSISNCFADPASDWFSTTQPATGEVRGDVKKPLADLSLVDTLIHVNAVGNVPGSEGFVGVKKASGRKKAKAAIVVLSPDDDIGKQHRSKINKGLEYAYKIALAEGNIDSIEIIKGQKPPSYARPTAAKLAARNKHILIVHGAAKQIADLVGKHLLRKINGGFTPYTSAPPPCNSSGTELAPERSP